ncbi:MAG: hypothetical protein Q4D07_03440 [Selenomonadaceae bacterium]|nr:hypothetical protein [Selenomonadaceae bacterium]
MDKYGMASWRYQALKNMSNSLMDCFRYGEDIVFLTDNAPESLYPYHVVSKQGEGNRLHLVTLAPLSIEGKGRIEGHRNLLQDLSGLTSLLYLDGDTLLSELSSGASLSGFFALAEERLGELLPRVLNSVVDMQETRCYFDFASNSYIPLEEGYDAIDLFNSNKKINVATLNVERGVIMGEICPEEIYPSDYDWVKSEVASLIPRIDGKEICNKLRQQRITIAKANGIELKSPKCPSIGACAGTCAKCDAEAAYLLDNLEKIHAEKRIIPKFEI